VGATHLLGCGASPLWGSYPALRAAFIIRLFDLRSCAGGVVLGGGAVALEKTVKAFSYLGLFIILLFGVSASACATPILVPQPIEVQNMRVPITVINSGRQRRVKPDHSMRKTCKVVIKSRDAFEVLAQKQGFTTNSFILAAMAFWDGNQGCPFDREVARILLDHAVGDPITLTSDYGLLSRLRDWNGILPATDASRSRNQKIDHMVWLRNGGGSASLAAAWPEKERLAFIEEADHWAFLEAMERPDFVPYALLDALLNKASAKYDPQRGVAMSSRSNHNDLNIRAAKMLIEGVEMPRDEARADELLVRTFGDEALTLRFTIAKKRLKSTSLIAQNFAMATLAGMHDPSALALLFAEIDRRGGIVEGGAITAADGYRPLLVTEDDYPSSAIRAEEEGVVSLALVIAPGGNSLLFETLAGDSPTLIDAAQRLFTRRSMRHLTTTRFPGRYLRVRLPDIYFRIGRSCGREQQPPLPELPAGTIKIDARCLVQRSQI
jgi:hypothetical protein